MSREKYRDHCPDCGPVLINAETGQRLPDDHPHMQTVLAMWKHTTLAEREAFHRFTCLDSRTQDDLAVMAELARRISAACGTAPCHEGVLS